MMALVKDAFGKERVPTRSYTPSAKPSTGGAPVYRPSAPSGGASGGYVAPPSQPSPAPVYTPPSVHADIIEQRAEQFRVASAEHAAQKSEVLANMRVRQQQARENAAAEKAQSWRASGARELASTHPAKNVGANSTARYVPPKSYVPTLQERLKSKEALEKQREEDFHKQLSDKQLALLPLLARLPDDFPAREWDTMDPKKQLDVMRKTDLTREEQWLFLNAAPSIRALMQVWDLQENREAYGLTYAELDQLTGQLLSIGNDRLGTQTQQIPFSSDWMRNGYLRYLDEKEAEAFAEVGLGRKQPSPADMNRLPATPYLKVTPYPEVTPLPQPSRAYVREWAPAQTKLFKELKGKVREDLSFIERIKGWNTTREALQKVFDYEDVIHEMADKYDVPAEYIETIMFREQRFYDVFDSHLADPAVARDRRDDSSTGVMQVTGKTAIKALNFAAGKEPTTYDELLGLKGCTYLDPENRNNRMFVWERMRSDDALCIEVATQNILLCADEMAPDKTFEDFNKEDAIKTLARYNGEGTNARTYGEECYHWLPSFMDYERSGDRHETY